MVSSWKRPSTLRGLVAAGRDAAGSGRASAIRIAGAAGPALSYDDLEALVQGLAKTITAFGLRRGDVVAIAIPNTLEYVVSFLGVNYGAGTAAPVNPKYKKSEYEFYFEDSNVKFLIVPEGVGNREAEAAANALKIPILFLSVVAQPTLRIDLFTIRNARRHMIEANASAASASPTPDDVALVLHTSGTTSKPKAVPLMHRNLLTSIGNIIPTYELSPQDKTYLVMPLFHVHGLMSGLLSTLSSGGEVVLPAAGRFSATPFWKDIAMHGCTWYTAVPTIHQILLSRASKEYPAKNPPKLRFIRSCSASLAPAILERVENTFGAVVLEAYAMTEASHQMTSNPLPKHGKRKPGTVGMGTGVEVVILDDNCNILPNGQIGEVCIRGGNVTKGYLNRPEANVEAFAGGWFHTGDQGQLDDEGYLTLTGRLKELINRGGEKISPIEIDSILLSHTKISEAVAFAVPDELYGQEVHAAVVLQPGAQITSDEILKFVGTKLAAMKVPKRLYISKEVPKTATGKIQRRIVAAHFLKNASHQPRAKM